MFRPTSISLALAIALAACSNGEENGDAGPASADPSSLVDSVAAAQCEKLFDCCDVEELDDIFGGLEVSDEAACEDAIRAQSDAFLRPALENSVSTDAIVLRESEIDTCVSALGERSCGDFEPVASADVLRLDGCADVVEPQLTLSAFCTEDFECETGFCSRPPAEAEGACKNPPGADDPCLNDRCGAGLYCTMDGICAEKLGVGDACTRNAECESDLCSPDEDGERVCESIPEICTGS